MCSSVTVSGEVVRRACNNYLKHTKSELQLLLNALAQGGSEREISLIKTARLQEGITQVNNLLLLTSHAPGGTPMQLGVEDGALLRGFF